MCTVLVTYDPQNTTAKVLMDMLALTKGVEIEDDVMLTEDEIIRIEKSKKSGVGSLDELKKFLRQ